MNIEEIGARRTKLYKNIVCGEISEKEAIAVYMSTGENYEEAEKSYKRVIGEMQKAKYNIP